MRPTVIDRLRRSPVLLGTVLIAAGVATGLVAHLGFSRPAPVLGEGASVGRRPGTGAPPAIPPMAALDPALVPPVAPPLDPPTPTVRAAEEPLPDPTDEPDFTDRDARPVDRAYDRLRAADARLAAAYARAADAGASHRDLRALRRDWNRARDEADWDPEGVAEAYDEMADDLDALTRDLLYG